MSRIIVPWANWRPTPQFGRFLQLKSWTPHPVTPRSVLWYSRRRCAPCGGCFNGRNEMEQVEEAKGINTVQSKRPGYGVGPVYYDSRVFSMGTAGRLYCYDVWCSMAGRRSGANALYAGPLRRIRSCCRNPNRKKITTYWAGYRITDESNLG